MSTKGIYAALSGAIAQDRRVETIANNLANVNTTGFKKDEQVFYEYVTANEKTPDVLQVPRIPASIESFYDMQGGDRAYVDTKGTFTDFSQGHLKNTGNPLDLALEGTGFFEVATPQGIRLSRNGSFKLNPQGLLVTQEGFPVLLAGQTGAPAQRQVRLDTANVTVSFSGDVYDSGTLVGRLSIVEPSEKEALQKMGSSLFRIRDNSGATLQPATSSKVHQGFIEGSNVNVISEMTDMIQATRTFQSAQQAIKAFDSMDEKLMNAVPRVTP